MAGKTLFDKIWDSHLVREEPDGTTLLYIDRHLLHEGSTHAFGRLEKAAWYERFAYVQDDDAYFAHARGHIEAFERMGLPRDRRAYEAVPALLRALGVHAPPSTAMQAAIGQPKRHHTRVPMSG